MPSYPYPLAITNPGAETGDTTGWTSLVGTLTVSSFQGGMSPRSGSYFFTGGSTEVMSASQDVALPAEVHADVDAGTRQVEFKAWQEGYSADWPDKGTIAVEFLDGGGNHLGAANSTYIQGYALAWSQTTLRCYVPPNTRTIRLFLSGVRYGGGGTLDAYWDDLTLQLVSGSPPVLPTYLPLLNASALKGDTTGWTQVLNNLQAVTNPRLLGEHGFDVGNVVSDAEHYLRFTIPSALHNRIDTGTGVKGILEAWHRNGIYNEKGKFRLSLLDISDAVLDSVEDSYYGSGVIWQERTPISEKVPASTRKVEVRLWGQWIWAGLDYFVDAVNVRIEDWVPARPSITSVSNISANNADVTSSPFDPSWGQAHQGTRYQVQRAGGDWTNLVYDSGWLGAVTTHTVQNLEALECYQVRAKYRDANLVESYWGYAYYFCAGAQEQPAGDFDWNDWAQLWNIGDARYGDVYLGPGGWSGPIQWDFFGTGPYGRWTDSGYNGNAGAFGRLMGPPSVLANKAIGPNSGVNVASKVSWYSTQAGFSWERWWECEFARAGVAAMVCGTCEPLYPALGWDLWAPYSQSNWPCTSDMQGVFAYIEPHYSFPYIPCFCWPSTGLVEGSHPLLHACAHYGLAMSADLVVEVWFNGVKVKSKRYSLPWKVTFSQSYPVQKGSGSLAVGLDVEYICRFFPWYGVRLKVWKDFAVDPTGKTHRIQAAVSTPLTSMHRRDTDYPDTGAFFQVEGEWGTGQADLPPEDGPWQIDETWVGGNEESVPGAGDGGLYCGWTGYGADRWTGAVPDKTGGGNVFRGFTALALDTSNCNTPCDADSLVPEVPPLEPPEYELIPGRQPCPPEVEGAFQGLFLGGNASAASIFQFGGYEVENGRAIRARIRPNPIAPEGYGGECLFKNLFVVVEHISDITVSVVPVLNGERLDRYGHERTFIGPGDRPALRRYRIPLHRAFKDPVVGGIDDERFRHGLRGTFFTFEMEILDLCGIGLQLPGVWLEYVPVREREGTGVVYTEDLLRVPAFVPSGQTFMGVKGANRVLKAASGTTDDEIQVEARAFANPVAPLGASGECEFRSVSLVVTRWNANDMDLKVLPYVDGEPLAPVTVHYKATTAPVTEITQVQITQYFRREGADAVERFRYHPRGAWFHLKVETGSGLQEWLTLEGGELHWEPVRESLPGSEGVSS